jgi:hypothetical protein
MDEVMAHMTTIEAALGLESDHRPSLRPKPDPHPRVKSTERVAARVAGALNDKQAGQSFTDLFDIRSAFVHGRSGLPNISASERALARALARRVVRALVDAASQPGRAREDVLAELLDRGLAIATMW